ncbi:hypothetical protein FGIG_07153 [Fasciola gigantica]|uniref:Uncharacterized protein n=1 Tax=Fasciola gigantica TaxID=46835 RepID=A0A504YX12_FASGI|nr:hypothetical protein FGIG_07153 [Fasciola gigantica]
MVLKVSFRFLLTGSPCRLIKKKGPSFIANRMENLIGDMDRVVYPQAHICGEEWD